VHGDRHHVGKRAFCEVEVRGEHVELPLVGVYVLRETTGEVSSETHEFRAEVVAARPAARTFTAREERLHGDAIALAHPRHGGPAPRHDSRNLMAEDVGTEIRRAWALVEELVQITPAEPRSIHANLHPSIEQPVGTWPLGQDAVPRRLQRHRLHR
jgi:hypothetical protein